MTYTLKHNGEELQFDTIEQTHEYVLENPDQYIEVYDENGDLEYTEHDALKPKARKRK